MGNISWFRWIALLAACSILSGCGLKHLSAPEPGSWSERVITEKELSKLCEDNPELSKRDCLAILSRLNIRGHHRVAEDIKEGRPIKVPNDFMDYKDWTPLPKHISAMQNTSKCILVVKDIPFLGWYEKGELRGDTPVCIGKREKATQAGRYKIKQKDINHVSGSYKNQFGEPAPMPWALRVYGHVWIHAGDVVSGYCSQGCINVPVDPAREIFKWAKIGTKVVIVESLFDLNNSL
jgi:hypothetical protein